MRYIFLFFIPFLGILLHRFWGLKYLLRYMRIMAAGNKILKNASDRKEKHKRIIISLTTIPSRIHHIFPTLNSLLLQNRSADKIYLNIPEESIREKRPYSIPTSIAKNPRITINRNKTDHGPVTKLLPTLELEKDPETIIITVDDDIIYPRDMVETLIKYHDRLPEASIGFRSWNIPPSGRGHKTRIRYAGQIEKPVTVDILEGMSGVLYLRKQFADDFFAAEDLPKEGFYVDDVRISGYLEKHGIPRYLVPHRIREPLASYVLTSLSNPLWKINRDGANNQVMIDYFFKRPKTSL